MGYAADVLSALYLAACYVLLRVRPLLAIIPYHARVPYQTRSIQHRTRYPPRHTIGEVFYDMQ